MKQPIAVSRAGLSSGDAMVMAVLGTLAFALYASLAFRLAQGVYLDYYNFAFDFDPVRTVDALASTPPDFLGFKHPLVVLLRPLAWPLLAAGLTSKESASLILAAFGTGSVLLCFVFLRTALVERPIATALTVFFAISSAQLFTSIIAETYGIAGFSIILTWVVAQFRLSDPGRLRRFRYAVGVLTFGTTVTNVMQTFIAEMLISWRWEGFARAVRRCFLFGLILTVPIVILAVAVWYHDLREQLKDPILALKEIYWLQTKGPRTGPGEVLLTFFTFAFVSPHYSWLMLPEGINMRDFRAYDFPLAGQIAAPFWLAFCAIGSIAAFRNRSYRLLAAGLAAALVCNLLFHLDFQFRGSLYIYSAHMHFLIFALACGLAPLLRFASPSGKLYVAVVLLMTLVTAADNLPIAHAFVADFDHVQSGCKAPCADHVGQ